MEAAGRKILKQNLCTKARFYKQPNVAANVSSTIVHQKSGGWRLGGYRRTDRRGIAHSSRWISSPFLAAPVQNEVRLHPCSTRIDSVKPSPSLLMMRECEVFSSDAADYEIVSKQYRCTQEVSLVANG